MSSSLSIHDNNSSSTWDIVYRKIGSVVHFAYATVHRLLHGAEMPPSRVTIRNRTLSRGSADMRKIRSRRNSLSMQSCEMVDYSMHGHTRPQPRSGHRIVTDNNNLYCFGGYNPVFTMQPSGQGLMSEVWQFNFSTRKWTLLDNGKDCPAEAASHSMILCGESLIVWGGTGYPFGERCSNQLHAFHIPTRSWRKVKCSGDIPSGRYGQSMTLVNGNIYIIGGTTGHSYNMNVHKLNLETLHWDPPVKMSQLLDYSDENPRPRYRHEVVTLDNDLYVLGGGTADRAFDFDEIPVYNVETKKWRTVRAKPCPKTQKFPPARRFHAAVQYDQYAFICGGFHGATDGNESIIFNDIWRLDLIDLQWTKMDQEMPIPTYFHSASVSSRGCMYIFGGVVTPNGDTRSNAVFKMWLTVPPLQEIAWNAVASKTGKRLARVNAEVLKDEGLFLPTTFWSRIKA